MMNKNHKTFIELKNLSKIYHEGDSERAVLSNINETFYSGEIIILLGRSGSGKSTLLNLISGIDLPTSGDIIIDKMNLTKGSDQQRTLFRRKHIGFVFQFFNLIPTLTVIENLLLPLELNIKKRGQIQYQLALAMLKDLGLENRENSFPDRLSGGEQQRVAIARALIHDPEIVLADEPTGNLDKETGQHIISLLNKLVKNQQKTMIMATHSTELTNLADRILTVQEGRLTEMILEKRLD